MLATNAGLLTPVLGDPSPWTPQRLYLNGEAGLYYEPADLTAEKVAWRRNLLTWTEDFDNAAWGKNGVGVGIAPVVTANAGIAPDGTTTAERVQFDCTNTSTLSNRSSLVIGFLTTIGVRYAAGVYIKAYDASNIGKTVRVASDGVASSVVTLTADWQRITNSNAASAATSNLIIETRGTLTGQTADVLLWGAQAEVGTTASAYQRITDFTSDFLAAFPTHTLYQDAAGTTPVTALGQPVGLALDKSRGALANAPELLATGVIALDGTATAATYNTTTGVGTASRVDVANQSTVQFQGLSNSALTRFRITNTGSNQIAIRTAPSGTVLYTINAGQTLEAYFQPAANRLVIAANSSGTTVNFTVVSVREVPGVHAIQPTSASRPALDARVNLLTYSEQFDNAAWAKSNCTVTANTTVAPDGTTTADTLAFTALNGEVVWPVGGYTIASAQTLIFSVALRAASNVTVSIGTSSPTDLVSCNVTTEWQRFTFTKTFTGAATAYPQIKATSGAVTVFAWGADLRLATDAAYPYQRVTTATDYADVGVPRSFLFDGFDDSLYTASTLDLSGTDKVTVWAGVYKNSDANLGIVLENTASSASNVGVFAVMAPTVSAQNFLFRSMGSLGLGGTTDAQFTLAAPVSRVVTGIGDIPGDITTLRLNGTQVATNTGDQGTGNYANAVLFIGRRNNTNLPFNGKLYIPVVRGAQTDAATLALTDRYVGSRMGIVL